MTVRRDANPQPMVSIPSRAPQLLPCLSGCCGPARLQTAQEAQEIVTICADANIQLMDGTMWMHGARTGRMEAVLGDRLSPHGIGPLKAVTSTFCFSGGWCRRCSARVHGAAPCLSGRLHVGPTAHGWCVWGPAPSTLAW